MIFPPCQCSQVSPIYYAPIRTICQTILKYGIYIHKQASLINTKKDGRGKRIDDSTSEKTNRGSRKDYYPDLVDMKSYDSTPWGGHHVALLTASSNALDDLADQL